MAFTSDEVYCTLVTSDSYVIGALVVARSLRQHGTRKPLVALITSSVGRAKQNELSRHFDQVIEVSTVSNTSSSTAALAVMGRPELAATFTKLTLWSQTQFRRIVYLDADTMVLKNLDCLFDIEMPESSVAASPELGFPDTMNSGCMVLSPSASSFDDLMALASNGETFDGGDQGVINMYFNKNLTGDAWHRLSFMYNVELYKMYRLNMPVIQHYRDNLSVVHFIGKEKPWTMRVGDLTGDGSAYSKFYREMVERWWHLAAELKHVEIRPELSLLSEDGGVDMGGLGNPHLDRPARRSRPRRRSH